MQNKSLRAGWLYWLCLLSGMLLGGAIVFHYGLRYLHRNLVQELPCRLPYEEAVRIFPERVHARSGWTVRTVPCGLPAPRAGSRITVFELCCRQYASAILTDPADRRFAAVLPCRIAIYEKEGQTFLARLNGNLVFRFPGGTVQNVFDTGIGPDQNLMLHNFLLQDGKPGKNVLKETK